MILVYIYIYIYMYILIVIHRQICFILSELISVVRQARFPKRVSKFGWLKRQSKILPLSNEETSGSEGNLNGYESQLLLFYIYLLNGYRELDSYEEPCVYANGNTITSFARELNPIYIYIVIHRQISFFLSELISVARQAGIETRLYIYIYIYIYIGTFKKN